MSDDRPAEWRHCHGCGENYNAFEESHVGHALPCEHPEICGPVCDDLGCAAR